MRTESVNYNESIRSQEFTSIEFVNVNGHCNYGEFQDVKSVTITKGCQDSIFEDVESVTLSGKIYRCKFKRCGNITVNGEVYDMNASDCSVIYVNGECIASDLTRIGSVAIHGRCDSIEFWDTPRSNVILHDGGENIEFDGDYVRIEPEKVKKTVDLDVQTGGEFGTLADVSINISGLSVTGNLTVGKTTVKGGGTYSVKAGTIKKTDGPVLYSSEPSTGIYDIVPSWVPVTLESFLEQMGYISSLDVLRRNGFYFIQDFADIQSDFGIEIVSRETNIPIEQVTLMIEKARVIIAKLPSAPPRNILSRICIQCKGNTVKYRSQDTGLAYCSDKCFQKCE